MDTTAIPGRDRGGIAVGKRADLIHVKEVGGMPVVRGSWCRGERAC
jgi:alpha-D-ribose 1-methylphosphonate 5-triphosphate diphosphatase